MHACTRARGQVAELRREAEEHATAAERLSARLVAQQQEAGRRVEALERARDAAEAALVAARQEGEELSGVLGAK